MTEQTQPTDAEIETIWSAVSTSSIWPEYGDLLAFARAVLAKWGTPVVAGEPVAIREAISHFRLMHWADEDGGLGLADALAQLYGDEDIGRASEELDMLADAIASIATTPQPTQAQAGAVPLTDEQCDAIYEALDAFGREVDRYEYGLPYCTSDGETLAKPEAREVIRQAAQNIKGADHA